MEPTQDVIDPKVERLKGNKESGFKYRERRSEDWRENYTLYRDRVIINRLEQRQSVNIPLMKTQLRTLLKDVDDMPVLYLENLDNDKQKEVFMNEYWKGTVIYNRMELKDIQDKKQEMFFGRTFDQMQIIDGRVCMEIIDTEDILVDRYMDPANLHSSRFLIHAHIFEPLTRIMMNGAYDQKKIADLQKWHETDEGLQKNASNQQMLTQKNEKMADLGVQDVQQPVLGETIIELTLHFVYEKREGDEEEQIYMYVEADDYCILMEKRLEEVIGVTKDHYWRKHFPYNTWADDIDKQDFWTDGVADIIRVPNQVLNSWFSQLVENRTLRNMGMQYYDSSIENFVPQTWEPRPFGSYGIPVPTGKRLDDVFKKIEIGDLSESLDEIDYIVQMTEKATGGTAALQGEESQKQITLGEFKATLVEAKERVKGMAKYYTQVWKDRAEMFCKFVEAAPDKLDAVKLYKKGRNSNDIYAREIASRELLSPSGYGVKIWSQEDKDNNDTNTLQKLTFAKQLMPDNPKLDEIQKRKAVEFVGLKPEEINEVMAFEEEKRRMMNQMMQNNVLGVQPGINGGLPVQPQGVQPAPMQ